MVAQYHITDKPFGREVPPPPPPVLPPSTCRQNPLCTRFLLVYLLKCQVQRDMQKILGVSSVAHYMALVCFLVQQGADTHARNRRGQTVMDMIPEEMVPALMNFINDVE